MSREKALRPNIAKQGFLLQPAAGVGTGGNITVLRFTGAVPRADGSPTLLPIADWVTIAHDATLGTLFTITRPGWYYMQLFGHVIAGATARFAIVRGAVVAPTIATAGVQAAAGSQQAAASFTQHAPGTMVTVTSSDIAAGDNVFRMIADNGAGGDPTAALALAGVGVRIVKGPPVSSVS